MEVGAVSGGANMPTVQRSTESVSTSITSTSGGSQIDNALGLELAMKILEMLAGDKEEDEGSALNGLMMLAALNQGQQSSSVMMSSHSVTESYTSGAAPTGAGENLNVEG